MPTRLDISHALESGRRLLSAIPLAVTHAGLPLFNKEDFYGGSAMSADFTGEGRRTMLGYSDAPVLSPHSAGVKLVELAMQYDFSMFEYWASDYAGHGQEMDKALDLLETFDRVLGGLLEAWDDEAGLIFITSDHGNLENLSTRRQTTVNVPGVVIGRKRNPFYKGLVDLTGVAGKIEKEVLQF